jgi:LmbE family N-acetylglucosaminyl deacetylase
MALMPAGAVAAGEVLRAMQNLPFAALGAIAPGTALVLAPHPDDESLGCGGLIAAACDSGRPPLLVFLTDGVGSHPNSRSHPPARLRALRMTEAGEAAAILGVPPAHLNFLVLPDTRAPRAGPTFDHAVETIAALARQHRVSTICTTWGYDPHGDHVAAQAIGAAAARLAGAGLFSYPVWSWLLPPGQMLPPAALQAVRSGGARLDIAPWLERKRRAIAAYASQHTGLITDDPDGFHLPSELLAVSERPFEVFLGA